MMRNAGRRLLAVALLAVAGCSPLPGSVLDPVYMRVGTHQPTTSSPASSGTPSSTPTTSSKTTDQTTAKSTASVVATVPTGVWTGRCRDSRGEGELTFSLVQTASGFSGTWRIRTGGGGSVVGRVERERTVLHMENTAPGCPGAFEGWTTSDGTKLVGAYHGKDCEGLVSDGWFELHAK